VRSTISGRPVVDVTMVEKAVLAMPAMSWTWIVLREVAASVRVSTTVDPSSFAKTIVTGAATLFGFASSRSVLKKAPVAPSASS
jgi:hypothetical protein